MKKYNKASFDDVLNEHDSVLILSWSDWENERPSNRWHYSRRLNRTRPVFFVNKPNGPRTINCNIDSLDSEFNFCIITPSLNLTYNEILVQVQEILAVDGFFRPLIWIYNAFYDDFDSVFQDSIAIYHATEDYFDLNVFPESNLIRNAIIDLSEKIDLWVFCSMGVLNSFEKWIYLHNFIYLPNGVDFNFFSFLENHSRRKSISYQGNIDNRLNFHLIQEVISVCQEYDFFFYGPVNTTSRTWKMIADLPNVTCFPNLAIEELKNQLINDSIAWIPFHTNEYNLNTAFPLKYFEYMAAGLPVVSVPMNQILFHNPIHFFAKNSSEFIQQIRYLMENTDFSLRNDIKKVARSMDYDLRFDELLKYEFNDTLVRNFNILLLINQEWMQIPSTLDHLKGLVRNVQGNFICMDYRSNKIDLIDHKFFDILIIHHSVRINFSLKKDLEQKIRNFQNLKILFVQDDYDNPIFTNNQIKKLSIGLVFSSSPMHMMDLLYPEEDFPNSRFFSVLPGYVTKEMRMYRRFWHDFQSRTKVMVYRGRKLPERYGALGKKKELIGDAFKEFLAERGFDFDISSKNDARIYNGWLTFLMSGKSTLITESGSSIVDWDGHLKIAEDLNPKQISKQYLDSFELEFPWNCISPKVFEAIALGTLLIGYRGFYSGILAEESNYLVLESNHTNMKDVLDSVLDQEYAAFKSNFNYNTIILDEKNGYEELGNLINREILNQIEFAKSNRKISVKQSKFNSWMFTIQKEDFTKKIRVFSEVYSGIPFFIPDFSFQVLSILKINRFTLNWKALRFTIFKFLISVSLSRHLLKICGRRSSRLRNYLSLFG